MDVKSVHLVNICLIFTLVFLAEVNSNKNSATTIVKLNKNKGKGSTWW